MSSSLCGSPKFIYHPVMTAPPQKKNDKTPSRSTTFNCTSALSQISLEPKASREFRRFPKGRGGTKHNKTPAAGWKDYHDITTTLSTPNNHIISMINHHSSYVFINYEHQLSIMNHQVLHPTIKNDLINQTKLRFSDSLPDLVTKQTSVI